MARSRISRVVVQKDAPTKRDFNDLQDNIDRLVAALPQGLELLPSSAPPPSNSSAPGVAGQVYIDPTGGAVYVCHVANLWRKYTGVAF